MLNDSDNATLEFILKMVNTINIIVNNHGGIDQALEDLEGQNALLMCILQIGENLNKIKNENLIKVLPVKESYGLRNLIAHHYDSVDIPTISEIIEFDIPDLREKLIKFIN